jgi:RNA polymerase sigma factor (sigma-70 family)
MEPAGLLILFEQSRSVLLRYLRAHGAGDAAEDCLQELWLKISAARPGPIANPQSYFFRMATNLMIDRRRAEARARRRDRDWTELASAHADGPASQPDPERMAVSRQRLAIVETALKALPARALDIFRRHRIDGRSQREIAADLGLSTSTIESDLRQVYRLLAEVRERIDEE